MTVVSPPRTAFAAAPPAGSAITTLGFRRQAALQGADPLPGLLGARTLSASEATLPLLSPAGAVADSWHGALSSTTAARTHGHVRYTTDGQWLYGHAEVDDRIVDGGLQAAARQVYAELFEVLAANGCPHLLRLWNYLADINGDEAGSERYRLFNAGRQQAFIEARYSAFDGAPAACALGAAGGPLRVSFLAGRVAPVAIENPRQVSAYRYPDSYGPRSPTFSRGAVADLGAGTCALFISGTASIVGHTSMHPGDVRRQAEESLANLAIVRNAAAARARVAFPAQDMTYTLYLRREADLPLVRDVFERHVGAASAAARSAVYVRADICRADLLVEIEAHSLALRGQPLAEGAA